MKKYLFFVYLIIFVNACGPKFLSNTQSFFKEHSCALEGNSCQEIEVEFDKSTDQNIFKNYRDLYQDITGNSAHHIKFYFGNLDSIQDRAATSLVIAFCDRSKESVFIDRILWQSRINNDRKQLLMLHELGHCAGGLSHDDRLQEIPGSLCLTPSQDSAGQPLVTASVQFDRKADECFSQRPLSIMHSMLFTEILYNAFKNEFHVEYAFKVKADSRTAVHSQGTTFEAQSALVKVEALVSEK